MSQEPQSVVTDTTELGRIHKARYSDAQCQMVFALMRLQDPRVDFILAEFNATIITGPRLGLEYGDYTPQVKVRELHDCKARIAAENEKLVKDAEKGVKTEKIVIRWSKSKAKKAKRK